MDEEWARYVCDQEDANEKPPPGAEPILESNEFSPLGYTNVIGRLDLIADRVMTVRTAVQASYTDKHQEPNFRPMPHPVTAIEKERERRTKNELEALDREFLSGEFSILE